SSSSARCPADNGHGPSPLAGEEAEGRRGYCVQRPLPPRGGGGRRPEGVLRPATPPPSRGEGPTAHTVPVAHPLLDVLIDAARGRAPAPDGRVDVLPALAG